jgi:small subunit ribosomal protein S17
MKIITGKVLHKNMQKTAKVAVERFVADPVYGKRMRVRKLYLVHDEKGAEPGQSVKFAACKPYSKLKRWKVVEVVGSLKDEQVKVGSKGKVKISKPEPKTKKLKK